jgi:hypothetical protein
VKLNVLLDLRADLPAFANLYEGDRQEVASLSEIPVYPGAYYVMNRGDLDFMRLHRLQAAGAFFVTRIKTTTSYNVVEPRPVVAEGICAATSTSGSTPSGAGRATPRTCGASATSIPRPRSVWCSSPTSLRSMR